jgi:glycosyltransferase involved in cell wall biosynthesis
MNVLFVHNNFPGQFRHLAQALSKDPGFHVAAIGSYTAQAAPGIRLLKYASPSADAAVVHPFARRFEQECRRAEEVLYSLSSLTASGFVPDVIFAHPGWGETLPLRAMFPKSRIVVYCEFFYGSEGRDVRFDPEFPMTGLDGDVGLRIKNASSLLALSEGDTGLSPTTWQRSTFPREFHRKIKIIHEGVDVDEAKPDPDASILLPSGRRLSFGDEVVTYVSRNLEPLRGYHIFMRALPRILKQRPNAQVVIVGDDKTSYGAGPPADSSWKSIFLDEVAGRLDRGRVHFLGRLPRAEYLRVLQISSAHVYLTYPFVLSWSLLEAMSAGCVIITSDTAPLQDVIDKGNGLMVPFFDVELLSDRVVEVLSQPRRFNKMRAQARRFIEQTYDAHRICLPQIMKLVR